MGAFERGDDPLGLRETVEGGKGFIRGTHTAWRYKDYIIIADEVFSSSRT